MLAQSAVAAETLKAPCLVGSAEKRQHILCDNALRAWQLTVVGGYIECQSTALGHTPAYECATRLLTLPLRTLRLSRATCPTVSCNFAVVV